jgi:hypothetical protein
MHRACDNDETCQRLLTHATGDTAAKHVFENINTRVTNSVMEELLKVERESCEEVSQMQGAKLSKTSHQKIIDKIGGAMVDKMVGILDKAEVPACLENHCVRCGEMCPLIILVGTMRSRRSLYGLRRTVATTGRTWDRRAAGRALARFPY